MNTSDKLQLIRALEEGDAARRRRSDWVAWGSVLLATVVLGAMIVAGRRELSQIDRRVDAARDELASKQEELTLAKKNLADVKAWTDEALRDLQISDGRGGGAGAIESAVDNLISASTSAMASPSRVGEPLPAPSAGDPSRRQLVDQLFDANGGVRVKAYGGLLPKYANDPTLVTEVLDALQRNPKNANGVYNALVVLSHMNAAVLRPYRDQIESVAVTSQQVGPRVSERARTLIARLPKSAPQ